MSRERLLEEFLELARVYELRPWLIGSKEDILEDLKILIENNT